MEQAFLSLRSQVKGTVVLPGDESYDDLRKTKFNQDGRPAIVVECQTSDDVVAAVNCARDNHLLLSIRSGGHSGAGFSTNIDGMVIDVSRMNEVELIDEQRHVVRVGAGARWGAVSQALQPHNLAISSGDTASVGVGGLSLGGGIGWMVRKQGLSIDNLEAVEIVTASGKTLRASNEESPDLFWAIRGGGGNFGVATAFEFRAVPCVGVFGGRLVFGADDRKTILTKWFEYMRTAPDELNSTLILSPGFGPNAAPQVMVIVCYASQDEAEAGKAIQPLRQLAPLVSDSVKFEPYVNMLESGMDMGPMKVRVRNGFIPKIVPELIDTLADNFGKPNTSPVQIRSLGGAMSRVSFDATAFECRDAEALVVMPSFSPADTAENQANQAADGLWAPIKPFVRGTYIGFLTDTSDTNQSQAYGVNLERLRNIKATYDPNNLFNQNINILAAK